MNTKQVSLRLPVHVLARVKAVQDLAGTETSRAKAVIALLHVSLESFEASLDAESKSNFQHLTNDYIRLFEAE